MPHHAISFCDPPPPSPLPPRHLQGNDPPAPRRPVTMPRGKKRKKGGEQNGDAEGGDANGAEVHAPETKRKEAKEDAQEPGETRSATTTTAPTRAESSPRKLNGGSTLLLKHRQSWRRQCRAQSWRGLLRMWRGLLRMQSVVIPV